MAAEDSSGNKVSLVYLTTMGCVVINDFICYLNDGFGLIEMIQLPLL